VSDADRHRRRDKQHREEHAAPVETTRLPADEFDKPLSRERRIEKIGGMVLKRQVQDPVMRYSDVYVGEAVSALSQRLTGRPATFPSKEYDEASRAYLVCDGAAFGRCRQPSRDVGRDTTRPCASIHLCTTLADGSV
jgi:hypothetical protein